MQEVVGDIFTFIPEGYEPQSVCIVVPTNGMLNQFGDMVMGKGVAKQAVEQIPGVDKEMGRALLLHGNFPYVCAMKHKDGRMVMSFPTKNHWRDKALPHLIARSSRDLHSIALLNPQRAYILPRPGCGNGGLEWDDVRPLVEHLPNNVFVIKHE